ncbi:BglG family transcription antiterminator LicT [Fundicoccus culcitae]|uniref:PRD domain-containing protein n=1 Tax=Fundicoccus culcitae TaxID=2969821 RepID=A0ABY5P950_9LACT|nr:PRD domain-containing protein [Fundicoccus culcitae]UUX35054.1 PRD domain-containing protein [Fundicoccus culcitae]
MNIEKVINNNIVIAKDAQGQETIAIGKGIGFQKKKGDLIQPDAIEKTFVNTDAENSNRLLKLLRNIPIEHVQIANDIINYAKTSLGQDLNENLYITLTDHINFAIERFENGVPIQNALLWEIKRFYNHEFLIGKEALVMIHQKLGYQLPEDEAGFIALHIVNAKLKNSNVEQITEMTKIIQNILKIVTYEFNISLDEYSLDYERFITHLKFFVQRLFVGQKLESKDASDFIFILKEKYRKEYQTALKISEYIENDFNRRLESDELMYLTIHINRITK